MKKINTKVIGDPGRFKYVKRPLTITDEELGAEIRAAKADEELAEAILDLAEAPAESKEAKVLSWPLKRGPA